MRYRLLETLREYGRGQSAEGERAALADRHAAYYLSLAEGTGPELHDASQSVWLERVEREQDNLRAVLGWALARGEADLGVRLDVPLSPRRRLRQQEVLTALRASLGEEPFVAAWEGGRSMTWEGALVVATEAG
jgi:predicted ATPase